MPLNQQIDSNTFEELKKDKEILEKQRLAILNILEDTQEGQKELKERYRDLNIIKTLIYELSSSLDIAKIIEKVIRAMRQILPEETNYFYCITPIDSASSQFCACFIYAQIEIGDAYFNPIKKSIKSCLEQLSGSILQREAIINQMRETIKFEVLGGYYSKQAFLKPFSLESVPIIIGNELLGIINISSIKPNYFTQVHRDIFTTIVGVMAETLSRLKILSKTEHSRTKMLVESLSDGVIMFDINKKVLLTNSAVQKMTGLPRDGFYLSEFQKLFPEQEIEKKISKTLQTGEKIYSEEIKIVNFIYELFVLPIYDPEKKIIGGAIILHDITRIKEIDKMKTEFISIASHQLRTPLSAVNWYTEMLLTGDAGELNEQQKEFLNQIYKGNQRMVALVNALLNVSRLEMGTFVINPEPTNIIDLARSVINELRPQIIQKKLEFIEQYNEKIPKINIDPKLIRIVFQNLLSNAVKYTPENGTITLKILLSNDNNQVLISVSDTGYGIPKNQQYKMFTKFFRADNVQEKDTDGTGLGLYITKSIIEHSDGKIWFESEENKGTTFYVSLPLIGMKKKEGTKRIE